MGCWVFSLLFLLLCGELPSLQVNGLTYFNTITPGESAQFCISLMSDKNTPEAVDLKLCDYSCNSQGQHFFEEISTQPRSNAKWITLGSYHETVNPGEKRDVYVTIKAPADSSLKGSYWSVLLIEPSDPLQTLEETEQGFQLNVKVRYAYHIVTNVGQGTPSLKITRKGIDDIQGKKFFAVEALNTGEIFLNPKMTLKLFTKQGKFEMTRESQKERLYPGSSSKFLADGQGIQQGTYTAFLLLDNGDGRMFGDNFEVTIP